jgi:hypothetical protein
VGRHSLLVRLRVGNNHLKIYRLRDDTRKL